MSAAGDCNCDNNFVWHLEDSMYSCVSNTACESDVLYIVPSDIPSTRFTYQVGQGETFYDPIIR
jgi:hypothetical protein